MSWVGGDVTQFTLESFCYPGLNPSDQPYITTHEVWQNCCSAKVVPHVILLFDAQSLVSSFISFRPQQFCLVIQVNFRFGFFFCLVFASLLPNR